MEKGINLTLTKSFVEFDKMLDQTIQLVSLNKLSVVNNIHRIHPIKFCAGKYVRIKYDEEDEGKYGQPDDFWIGFCCKETNKHKFCILLEFDILSVFLSSGRYFTNAEELAGTSGKYYSEVECEYTDWDQKSWIHFCLKNKYLKQFYGENIDKNTQLEILTGFISEILEKCGKKREQKAKSSKSEILKEVTLEDLMKYERERNFSGKGVSRNIFSAIFGEIMGTDKDK